MLAMASIGAQSQKQVVWNKPQTVMSRSCDGLELTKVEKKQDETILHLRSTIEPNLWIRFSHESFLQTPDGTKYPILHGTKTNDTESDITLDSLFWMPESGRADFAIHFKPVPLDTEEIDFLEGYSTHDFKFWNINDGKRKRQYDISDDWKKVKYAKDETLPEASISKDTATIKVKLLGYKPAMKLQLLVVGTTSFGDNESIDKMYDFADNGTVEVKMPLRLPRELTVGIQEMGITDILIAPGQETSILMKVTADHNPFVEFKGFLARTNKEMCQATQMSQFLEDRHIYTAMSKCSTPEERLQRLTSLFNGAVDSIRSAKLTTATKDLLCMQAEFNYMNWMYNFARLYSEYVMNDGVLYMSRINYEERLKANKDLLVLTPEQHEYTIRYLNQPTSYCSRAFWYRYPFLTTSYAKQENSLNADLHTVSQITSNATESYANEHLASIKSEDCKAVVRDFIAEQKRIANMLNENGNIFYKRYDNVAPDNILQTILDNYKGQTVLIDIWATWCGPCRAGHSRMAPMKEQMKGSNVKFVYITSNTSPFNTWKEMITDIPGDHYYLTLEQYRHLLRTYESNGIPTYAIYNSEGTRTYKVIGLPQVEEIKTEIEKALGMKNEESPKAK